MQHAPTYLCQMSVLLLRHSFLLSAAYRFCALLVLGTLQTHLMYTLLHCQIENNVSSFQPNFPIWHRTPWISDAEFFFENEFEVIEAYLEWIDHHKMTHKGPNKHWWRFEFHTVPNNQKNPSIGTVLEIYRRTGAHLQFQGKKNCNLNVQNLDWFWTSFCVPTWA